MPDDEPTVLGVTEAQLRNVATAAHQARTASARGLRHGPTPWDRPARSAHLTDALAPGAPPVPDRPPIGTTVRVALAPGCGDPWPGTVMPSRRLPASLVNVMAHPGGLFTPGAVVTVSLDQLQPAHPDLPGNWAKFSRALAEDLAREHDLAPEVRRGIRLAFYRALQLTHSELPPRLDRARREGLADAWRIVANLPDGATAVDAARALTTAAEHRPAG